MSELGKDVFTSEDIFTTMRFSDLRIEEMFPATLSFGNSRMFLYAGIAQCQRMAEALTKYKTAEYDATKMTEQDQRLLPPGSMKVVTKTVEVEPKKVEEKDICRNAFEDLYKGSKGITILKDLADAFGTIEQRAKAKAGEQGPICGHCGELAEIRIRITTAAVRRQEQAEITGPHWEPREVDDFLRKWSKYKLEKEPFDKENQAVILNELQPYNQTLMWWAMAWEPVQRAHYNLLYAVNSRTFRGFIQLGREMYQREHEANVGQRRRWPWSGDKKKEEEEE